MESPAPGRARRLTESFIGERGTNALANARYRAKALAVEALPAGRKNHAALEEYRARHAGDRCVIIGNGPSLKITDMSLLKNEVTFGLNRIYLAFEKLGYSTTYLAVVNQLVVEQCAEEFRALDLPVFSTWANYAPLRDSHSPRFLHSMRGPHFSDNATRGVWEGATVTYVAMQLAAFMGFKQIVLVGVDHNFATKGQAHRVVTSEADDPNHFDPRYFGRGFRWQLPDLETSEIAYALAGSRLRARGGEIIDATVGGKLQVFPKVPLEIALR